MIDCKGKVIEVMRKTSSLKHRISASSLFTILRLSEVFKILPLVVRGISSTSTTVEQVSVKPSALKLRENKQSV